VFVIRRKRAAHDDDDADEENLVPGSYISHNRITSPDAAEPPPESPIHEGRGFPTDDGITESEANDLCLDAIRSSDLYQTCESHAAVDTQHYVQSCVDDIKVTSVV